MLIQYILHQAKVQGFPKSEVMPGVSYMTPRRAPRSRHLFNPVLSPVSERGPLLLSTVLVERLVWGEGKGC